VKKGINHSPTTQRKVIKLAPFGMTHELWK